MLRQWRSGKTVNKCKEESVSDSDGSIEEEEKPEEFWKRLGNTCEEEFPKIFLPSWLKRMANEEPENFLELVANFDKEELESGEKGTPMPDWQRSLLENDPRKFLKLCQEEENSDGGGDSVNWRMPDSAEVEVFYQKERGKGGLNSSLIRHVQP